MEFALWRTQHHRMYERDYCDTYFSRCPPSELAEKFEGGVLLYTLKPCPIYSSKVPDHISVRLKPQ
ncbi:hypothetical protein B0O99DRAFT_634107 [Bisporella sp. PMI_857]|nr:hypothetical protein B0O99DRAFT_634107 [Bisporella sp. PMI_857]